MKKTITLLSFWVGLSPIFGQGIWHLKMPFSAITPPFANLNVEDEGYIVSNQNRFSQFAKDGRVIGTLENLPQFVNWVSAKTDEQTNRPYFLLVRRQLVGDKYFLAHYQPGEGLINEQVFEDSLFSFTQRKSPLIVELDDSTMVVYGSRYARKIRHHVNGSFTEAWKKTVNFDPVDVVKMGNKIIVCGLSGTLKAFDEAGNLLWEKFFPFDFSAVQVISDGFVVIGVGDLLEPVLLRLDTTGNLIWSKTIPGKAFNDALQVSDGGFVLVGQSDAGNFLMLKTDPSGQAVWAKEMGVGRGVAIDEDTNGGLVVLYQGTMGSIYLMRTNGLGETVPVQDNLLISERNLNNGGFSLTQSASSSLFFNYLGSTFHIPVDSLTTTINSHCPWLAGLDAAGNLHKSASKFGELFGNSDFRVGHSAGLKRDFSRVWSVTQNEIAQFRRDFEEDGMLHNSPPYDFLTWPAKGNIHFRQNYDFTLVSSNPDSLPAPFIDTNGDGIYNVFDGDYPRLLGDRMLWWAITDQTLHPQTPGNPLSVDLFISLFAYDCPQNAAVLQTVFADYQIINRSGETYTDTYIGFYADPDLGCDADDYFGSMADVNSFFIYNKDKVDGIPGASCPSGAPTFGSQIPVQTISFLNQSLDGSMPLQLSGGAQGDPASPIEYYNYLRSIWRDNTPLTVGGSGYAPSNPAAPPTRFGFPDNPNNPQGWNMCTSNLPWADHRVVNSHGPFTFAAGDTFNIQLAFTFHPNIPHPCPDVETWVKPTIQQIQQWHDDGTLNIPLNLDPVQILQPGQSLTLDATVSTGTAYVWSTGATTSSIVVNQVGLYTVTVTRASGCENVETVLVKLASGTSTPTLPSWTLQPNPANDVLKIVFENAQKPFTTLLYNAQGQLVGTKTGSGSSVEMPVASLPPGFYWAETWEEEKFQGSRKVLIVR